MSSFQQPTLKYASVEEIPSIVARLRNSFATRKTYDPKYRANQLKQLSFAIKENENAIFEALRKDLGRSTWETDFAEITLTIAEAIEAAQHVGSWAKPSKPWAGIAWATHGTQVRKEPKGTVLVIGAWNYPITLTLGPVIAAIAAGNTVVLKPSEVSANTARLLAEIFPKYLDPDCYTVINGAVPETTAILDQRFEHIFYTGNGTVGRIIQEKAAKWLCPVSLELGGKSPTWVDESADMAIAAKRIMWGKNVNAGQTCIAPDYVLCTPATQTKLIAEFKKAEKQFWPEGNSKSEDFAKIVNSGHWNRLRTVLDATKGDVVVGGSTDAGTADNRHMPFTIVSNVKPDDSVMAGEIFGPVLPIVPVRDIKEAVEFINARDQPLALYAFGADSKIKYLIDNTQSGGVVIGDTLLHFAISALPFGGTGPSGYGNYHGKNGFDTFSHSRATLIAPHRGFMGKTVEMVMSFRYPPYTTANLAKFKLLVGKNIPFSKPSNPTSSSTQIR